MTVSWDRGLFPPARPLSSERGCATSITLHAVLIKGCDVGYQLSLLEPIPEISHHLPRPYASRARCDATTPLFKNTSPLVCGQWKDGAVPEVAHGRRYMTRWCTQPCQAAHRVFAECGMSMFSALKRESI